MWVTGCATPEKCRRVCCVKVLGILICGMLEHKAGLPRWLSGKESACQCRKRRRHEINPWVGKIPWRRKWQPTPVLLPGKSHGRRSLVGYSPRGRKESETTEQLSTEHKVSVLVCWIHALSDE